MHTFTPETGTSSSSHLTDRDLICNLLDIPVDEISGDTVAEIIDHLLNNSIKPEKTMIVREIAHRYGAKRMRKGDPFLQSTQVYDHFRLTLGAAKQESFCTLILDNKHRLIKVQLISLGTLNQSLVHPREVFAPAIELRAAAIILVHNHPSGDPVPSNQDLEIANRLSGVGDLVGIKVLDHVIIGNDKYYSFVDENMMPQS
jgi:DNA repair protein RadC